MPVPPLVSFVCIFVGGRGDGAGFYQYVDNKPAIIIAITICCEPKKRAKCVKRPREGFRSSNCPYERGKTGSSNSRPRYKSMLRRSFKWIVKVISNANEAEDDGQTASMTNEDSLGSLILGRRVRARQSITAFDSPRVRESCHRIYIWVYECVCKSNRSSDSSGTTEPN